MQWITHGVIEREHGQEKWHTRQISIRSQHFPSEGLHSLIDKSSPVMRVPRLHPPSDPLFVKGFQADNSAFQRAMSLISDNCATSHHDHSSAPHGKLTLLKSLDMSQILVALRRVHAVPPGL